MNGLILTENLFTQDYHKKKSFCSSIDDGKRGKGDGHISYSQYLHLKFVWKEFRFKKCRAYHNHYLKKDALL